MKYYEIRIFNAKGSTSLIFHRLHSNDRAAVQAAREIAEDRQFDVWQGMECIFSAQLGCGRKN
jgi:hypothetical protein